MRQWLNLRTRVQQPTEWASGIAALLCGLWSENNFLRPTGTSMECAHLHCYADVIICIVRLDRQLV